MNIPSIMDLLALWRDTIVGYSALSSYCVTNFGSGPSIFIGVDHKNPPSIDDSPFIALHPMASRIGIMDPNFTHNIEIHVGIIDATYSDYQSKNVAAEMRGLYRVNDIATLIKDALDATAPNKYLAPDMIDITIDTESFPLVQAHMQLQSSMANTIGASVTL